MCAGVSIPCFLSTPDHGLVLFTPMKFSNKSVHITNHNAFYKNICLKDIYFYKNYTAIGKT